MKTDVIEALEWALNEINGKTRYDTDEQFENALSHTEAILEKAKRYAALDELAQIAQEAGDYTLTGKGIAYSRQFYAEDIQGDCNRVYWSEVPDACGAARNLEPCSEAELIDAIRMAQSDREYPGKDHLEKLQSDYRELKRMYRRLVGHFASIIADPDCCAASKEIARTALKEAGQ